MQQNQHTPNELDLHHELEADTEWNGTENVPTALKTGAGWAWRIIVIAVVLAGAGWFVITFSSIFIALMVAILLAVILEPLAALLRNRFGWPRAAAAAFTLILLIVVVGGMLVGSGTSLFQGFSQLSDQIKTGMDRLIDLANQRFPAIEENLTSWWDTAQDTLKNNSGKIVGGVASVGSSVTSFLTGLVVALFSLFFFLKDGRRLWHWVVRLFPTQYRDLANESGIRAWVTVGSYAKTQAIVAAVDAVGIALIAFLLKTPFTLAFPIAVIVFIFSFIPIVGAFLSGFVAVVVVLVNTGSVWMALAMLAGVLVVQQVEGNVLQPVLQGNALNMHALAIFLFVAGGSAVAGIVGALFAVPIAAAVNTVILYVRGHDTFPYLNTDPNRPGGPQRAFEEYAEEHWAHFDAVIVQHVHPRERKKAKRAKARAVKAAAKTLKTPHKSTETAGDA